MEACVRGRLLHVEDQRDSHVYTNREGSEGGYGNERGYIGTRRGRLFLDSDGGERQERNQRSQRDVPVYTRCTGKNAGDGAGDYRHPDSWARGGDYRKDGTGRGAYRQRPAGADHCGGRHIPALYGAARTGPAHDRHRWREPPRRHLPAEGDNRCTKIEVSNDDHFLITPERRRRRAFALVAKSRDNGLVVRGAAQIDREAEMKFIVGWTAEKNSPRGAGG